ncbi:MAG: DNA polymerase III subunit gamma/tau [Lachnospiraceae bacterium]|nr:DNA polymerase III subunit gamma/tau [Robinsoniella sp.]MDY3766668.1 DNA polymerase III subunit gamma/tau [Lachnospiraceae bacterium]
MSYTALYRKFRPDEFSDVKGQDHIVTTLKNQIKADRIGHAYLFCGTRGTGKTTIAKIFAKAVNCEHPVDGSPCNECDTCKAIAAGTSLNVIEIDAASNNGVDNIREIKDEVAYSPTTGKYKVYIIDEVHMLSIGAFNALLKTLEEPPSYVIFILATTEVHKIPVTILSRCQRYDFKRIPIGVISDRLKELMDKEGIEVEEKAIRYIAKKADGGMRDALSLLEQCISFYLGEKLTYDKVLDVLGAVDTDVFSKFLREILSDDVAQVMTHLEEIVMQGRDLGQFVNDFTWYMRNLLLIKASDNMEEILDVSTENLIQLREEAGMIRQDTLMRFIRIFSELANQMKTATNKRILLEVALIKLCRPQMEPDVTSLLERVRRLEKKLEQGMIAVPAKPEESGMGGQARVERSGQNMLPEEEYSADFYESAQGIEVDQDVKMGKAAPEDLRQVQSMWRSIVAMTSGRFKVVLASAQIKFNASAEDDNRLYVVFADFLAEPYVGNQEKQKELEDLIAKKIGKRVEVKMILQEDESFTSPNLAQISVDDAIEKFIHADVVVEDF